jgi:hypothetical protein
VKPCTGFVTDARLTFNPTDCSRGRSTMLNRAGRSAGPHIAPTLPERRAAAPIGDGAEDDEADGGGTGGGEAGRLLSIHRAEIARQDETLDQMSVALQRLGELSRNISAEVDAQAVMIDSAAARVDDSRAAIDATTKRVNELVRSNGGWTWCCAVVALSAIALLLFLIIIFGG